MTAQPEVPLERAEFFRALEPARLERLRPVIRTRRFTRQHVLFLAGEPASHLFVAQRGEVRLYASSPSGRITTLESLGPGSAFGAIYALEQETYPASAEALSEGVAWCLPRPVLLRLLADEPRLAVEILRIVSRRLHEAHRQLRSFAHDPAPTRLARALLRSAREGEARVTRRALADAAGTTVETAIRVLRRFEREGILRGEVGCLHVVDEPALRRLAGEG
jgi:CRP-like cAMP-binding protein